MLQAGRGAKEVRDATSGITTPSSTPGVQIGLEELPAEVVKWLSQALSIRIAVEPSPSGLHVQRFVHASIQSLLAPFVHCRLRFYAEYSPGAADGKCDTQLVQNEFGLGLSTASTLLAMVAFENADHYFSLELSNGRLELMFGRGELFRRYALLFRATGEERVFACNRDAAARPVVQHKTSNITVGDFLRWVCCAAGRIWACDDFGMSRRQRFMNELQRFVLGVDTSAEAETIDFSREIAEEQDTDPNLSRKIKQYSNDIVGTPTIASVSSSRLPASARLPRQRSCDSIWSGEHDDENPCGRDAMLETEVNAPCIAELPMLEINDKQLDALMLSAHEIFDEILPPKEDKASQALCQHPCAKPDVRSSWSEGSRNLDESFMKRLAVQALGQLTERGNATSIALLGNSLKDNDVEVREASLHALMQVSRKGDKKVFAKVLSLTSDENARVRNAAVEVMGSVAIRGDLSAVGAIGQRLSDKDWMVRRTAAKLLARVASPGCPFAIGLVAGSLAEGYGFVTRKVTETLTDVLHQVARQKLGCSAASDLKEEGDVFIKQAVLEAQQSDIQPLVAVTSSLEVEYGMVRQALVQTLQQLAPKGHRQAVVALTQCLGDPQVEVVDAAIQALSHLAEKGDKDTVASLSKFVNHTNWGLRCAAVQALAQIIQPEDTGVIAGLVTCLEDKDEEVRDAAKEALKAVAWEPPCDEMLSRS
jgi:HEAT repeat protein